MRNHMDKNHQDKTEGKLIATENKSRLTPFSLEDESEAQKELEAKSLKGATMPDGSIHP